MIKVILPERTLGITFIHEKIAIPILDHKFDPGDPLGLRKPSHRWERRTKCEIVECDAENPKKFTVLGQGAAKCHHKDNFVKDTGRKLSLVKAMQIAAPVSLKPMWKFTHFERTAIWDAYHNRAIDPLSVELERIMRDELTLSKGEARNELNSDQPEERAHESAS